MGVVKLGMPQHLTPIVLRPRNGAVEQRELSPEQLAVALEECFELKVESEWMPLLERIVEIGSRGK